MSKWSSSDPAAAARLGPARFMFTFDAVTAGALGAGLLALPDRAGRLLFAAPQDPVSARLIGAVFAGFAVVSVAGARNPAPYLSVFLAQGAYKALWLATVLPVARRRPPVAGMAASFVGYLAGYAIALRAACWPVFGGPERSLP